VTRKLSPDLAARSDIQKLALDEKKFLWLFNEDTMATEKPRKVCASSMRQKRSEWLGFLSLLRSFAGKNIGVPTVHAVGYFV
jgi:hypothetical protein